MNESCKSQKLELCSAITSLGQMDHSPSGGVAYLGNLTWRRRCPRPVVVQWSLTAETLLKKICVRRVLFDTGFGFRVQIDLVPRAFGAALSPKPKNIS